MLSVPLNKGVKPSAKPTLPIGWHWFTLHAVQADYSSKLPTQTHQLHYLASRTLFSDTVSSYNWSWATLPLQRSSFHPTKC